MGDVRALLPDIVEDLSDADIAAIYEWPRAKDTAWLRMNFAASIDGALTDGHGLSAGVSSADDKRVFALLRATCDAVLVGAGTARAEGYRPVKVRDSMLGLRKGLGLTTPPRLVIFSNRASLDPASSAFAEAAENPQTVVITSVNADPVKVAALREVATVIAVGEHSVDLVAARERLLDMGMRRLLCEGGPTLFGNMLTAGIVDDLCLTTSPLISGQSTESRTTLTGRSALATKHNASLVSLVQANDSLLARWRIAKDGIE